MQIRTETAVGFLILTALISFFYLTFQIGLLRFDQSKYNKYTIYLPDASGINQKTDIKIAGIKIGYVENIKLEPSGKLVKLDIKILKDYQIYKDSKIIIKQESMMGTKFLEIIQGNDYQNILNPGEILPSNNIINLSIDEIFKNMQNITYIIDKKLNDVNDNKLQNIIDNFSNIIENISKLTLYIQEITINNEKKALDLINNSNDIIKNIKNSIPEIVNQISKINEILKIKDEFNINSSINKINSIIEKIDEGQGTIGQLLNDKSVYKNIKILLDTAKSGCDRLNEIRMMLDSHTESMHGGAEKYEFKNSKAYLNLWFFPRKDYFYVTGLAYSQKGYISRNIVYADFFDEKDRPIFPSQLVKTNQANDFFSRAHFKNEKLDSLSLNLQVGKLFEQYDFSLRVGLFEGYPGFAFDYYIPFDTDKLKWISTFEAWDFKGRNRVFHDVRPHFKWLNRFFITSNIYLTFGANDFISKYNKNIFFGIGIRFDDNKLKDDLKYIYYKTAFAQTLN